MKQTEIGEIPEDWDLVRLGEIGENFIGLTYSPSSVNTYGTLVLRSSNVQNGQLAFKDNVYVKMDLPSRVITKKNDILICVRNGSRQLIGKCALINEKAEGSAFGAFMTVYRTDYFNFIFHQFNSEIIQKQIRVMMGATINQITNKDLKSFIVPLPRERKEQDIISTVLADMDNLIQATEQLINKKQLIKTATMQNLLTGKIRLAEFDTKKTKPSELGEIPSDWFVVSLKTIGKTYNGLTGKTKENFGIGNSFYVPFTNVMANVEIDQNQIEKVEVTEYQNIVLENDILFNGSSETPEEVCFSSFVGFKKANLYLNSFCFGFRVFDTKKICPKYIAYWFRSSIARKTVSFMAQGSTRYNISKSQFLNLQIVLPQIKEQIEIVKILSDMDKEISELNEHLTKLNNIKQGLMQKLLTGKIRLTE